VELCVRQLPRRARWPNPGADAIFGGGIHGWEELVSHQRFAEFEHANRINLASHARDRIAAHGSGRGGAFD
jgi:hypothetical protein